MDRIPSRSLYFLLVRTALKTIKRMEDPAPRKILKLWNMEFPGRAIPTKIPLVSWGSGSIPVKYNKYYIKLNRN
jgi:hypothetical protein